MSSSRRAVILQSSYIPWKGYFDLLAKADVFVIYDSVQFSKQSWRNRNKIRTENGTSWLSIPVQTSGKLQQPIDSVQVADAQWANSHLAKIEQSLKSAKHFATYAPVWRELFDRAAELSNLHEINILFLRHLAETLEIQTEIVCDRDVGIGEGTATERLVTLCQALDADSYLTGPAGLDYLEHQDFAAADIELEVIDYSTYPTYTQTHDGFEPGVTVLDLLANVGSTAAEHLCAGVKTVEMA